jgi:hypothetical protein
MHKQNFSKMHFLLFYYHWFNLIILDSMYALFMMQMRHIKYGNHYIFFIYNFEYYTIHRFTTGSNQINAHSDAILQPVASQTPRPSHIHR